MIYFDNSATTKPYEEVVESFVKVSTSYFGNPSSLHGLGGQAEKLLTQARAQTAELLSVKEQEIVFTSGGTEGNNLAIKGAALAYRGRGRHVITINIEHPSVFEAVQSLTKLGYDITVVPVNEDGVVTIESIREAIREDTILVSVMHVNNEVGTIQPIQEIGKLLSRYPKIIFHVDNVQGIGKVHLDLKKCHIDLCTISAHKFHGLKGTGALYIREGTMIDPLLSGGNQESTRRSGTENVAGAVALAKALRITLTKCQQESDRLQQLLETLRNGLTKIDGVIVHTPVKKAAPHIVNFSLPHSKSEIFVHALEEKNIFVSTTSACSSKKKATSSTLLAMDVAEERANRAIRLSLSYQNTQDEVKIVLEAIAETIEKLRKVRK